MALFFCLLSTKLISPHTRCLWVLDEVIGDDRVYLLLLLVFVYSMFCVLFVCFCEYAVQDCVHLYEAA